MGRLRCSRTGEGTSNGIAGTLKGPQQDSQRKVAAWLAWLGRRVDVDVWALEAMCFFWIILVYNMHWNHVYFGIIILGKAFEFGCPPYRGMSIIQICLLLEKNSNLICINRCSKKLQQSIWLVCLWFFSKRVEKSRVFPATRCRTRPAPRNAFTCNELGPSWPKGKLVPSRSCLTSRLSNESRAENDGCRPCSSCLMVSKLLEYSYAGSTIGLMEHGRKPGHVWRDML